MTIQIEYDRRVFNGEESDRVSQLFIKHLRQALC